MLESDVERIKGDLYGPPHPGLRDKVTGFFAIQGAHDKWMPLKIGLLAIVLPIGYDLIKHAMGWH